MNRISKRVVWVTAALLTGCAEPQPQMSMPYSPGTLVFADKTHRQTIRVEHVAVDREGRNEAAWFGTIKGGFGNTLKLLYADAPVDQIVQRAFDDGLKRRDLYSGSQTASKIALAVKIHRFDASQLVRREAIMDFSLSLVDRTTGQTVWNDRHRVRRVEGSRLASDTGIFASSEDLRVVALRAMSEAVDTLLDKEGFRTALR